MTTTDMITDTTAKRDHLFDAICTRVGDAATREQDRACREAAHQGCRCGERVGAEASRSAELELEGLSIEQLEQRLAAQEQEPADDRIPVIVEEVFVDSVDGDEEEPRRYVARATRTDTGEIVAESRAWRGCVGDSPFAEREVRQGLDWQTYRDASEGPCAS